MRRFFWVVGLLCLGMLGCLHSQGHVKTPEDIAKEKDLDIRTIGDVTELANPGPWQVSGVGLVTGLDGTGGSPKGQYREMLEKQLRQQQAENSKTLLDSPD